MRHLSKPMFLLLGTFGIPRWRCTCGAWGSSSKRGAEHIGSHLTPPTLGWKMYVDGVKVYESPDDQAGD